MAKSRTKILIPMLALCVLAVSAYGQAVLTLGSNPTRVRAEGLTEVVGLITLSNNTNAIQVIPGGTTIAIVFDGVITNAPGLSNAAVGAAPTGNFYTTGKDAIPNTSSSMLGNAGAGKQPTITQSGATITLSIPTTYGNDGTGTCVAGTAGATNLCLIPGGSLNIQGVRVAVAGLTGNIYATLTTVPANAITFPGGQNATVVGRAQATIGRVDVVGAPSIGQCLIGATPTLTSAGAISSGALPGAGFSGANPLSNGFYVNITEPGNFPTSFSAANSGGVGSPYSFDEAGITPAALQNTALNSNMTSGNPPVPVVGVQFTLAFSGMPAGETLIAQQQALAANANGGSLSDPSTKIASGTNPNLTIGWVKTSGSGSTASTLGTSTAAYLLVAASGGAASITYEVASTGTAASSLAPTTVDTVTIAFLVSAPAGTVLPVGSLGAVQASVAPVSTSTSISSSSTTLRFAANSGIPSTAASIGTVTPCLTNLLFPFVSNNAKTTFNTGIAIANTANDATFGSKAPTVGQTGGVTLFYFGSVGLPTGGNAGIAMAIPAISTGGTVATAGVVAPGEHTSAVLSTLAPGFQGYIVALCAFQYAHGLATIFDNFGVGPANVGFSYLPLVLNGTPPARSATGNNSTSSTLGAGGESLAH